LTKYSHFEFSSARELDDKVADELEAMERNGVLPKRWNGSAEREHLNTQRQAWTHAKKKDRDDKLAHQSFSLDGVIGEGKTRGRTGAHHEVRHENAPQQMLWPIFSIFFPLTQLTNFIDPTKDFKPHNNG